jgi:hypothetical protein
VLLLLGEWLRQRLRVKRREGVEAVGRRAGRGGEETRGQQQPLSGLCPRRSAAVWCESVAVWVGKTGAAAAVGKEGLQCIGKDQIPLPVGRTQARLDPRPLQVSRLADSLLSSLLFGRSWKPTVERSSDSTLDTGEMELSGRDRAAKGGQVGWGVCRVRENLVAGLG